MIEAAYLWADQNLFSASWFWWVVLMLAVAVVTDLHKHWRDDLPWWGWDLRKMERWRPLTDVDPED